MRNIDKIALRIFKANDNRMFCNTDTLVKTFSRALLSDSELLVELARG